MSPVPFYDDGHVTLRRAVHHDRGAGITRGGRPHDDTVLRGASTGSELPDADRGEKSRSKRTAQRPLRTPGPAGDGRGPGRLGGLDAPHDSRPEPRPVRIGDRDVLLKKSSKTAQPVGFALTYPTSCQMGCRRARRPFVERSIEVGAQSSPVQIVAQHVGWTVIPHAVILVVAR